MIDGPIDPHMRRIHGYKVPTMVRTLYLSSHTAMEAISEHYCQFTSFYARIRPTDLRFHYVHLSEVPHCSNNAGQTNTSCNCRKEETAVRKKEPRLANLRRRLNKRYIKASQLFSATDTLIASPCAFPQNSAAITETVNDMEMT
jgi:hypothetical protein